jgi:hypothetical protein
MVAIGRVRAQALVVAASVIPFLLPGLVPAFVLVLVVQSGCSTDDSASARLSRRGEVCQVARDCEDGLFCAPVPNGSGGVCVTGNFKIAKTTKSCVLLECTGASDCCSFGQCDAGSNVDCELGKCVFRCTDDTQCEASLTGNQHCAGGKCVRCTTDRRRA